MCQTWFLFPFSAFELSAVATAATVAAASGGAAAGVRPAEDTISARFRKSERRNVPAPGRVGLLLPGPAVQAPVALTVAVAASSPAHAAAPAGVAVVGIRPACVNFIIYHFSRRSANDNRQMCNILKLPVHSKETHT